MADAYQVTYSYYNLRIDDDDSVANIIEALQKMPPDAKIDLTQAVFRAMVFRLDRPGQRDA